MRGPDFDRIFATEAECNAYLDGLLVGATIENDEDGIIGLSTTHIVPAGDKFRAVVVILSSGTR